MTNKSQKMGDFRRIEDQGMHRATRLEGKVKNKGIKPIKKAKRGNK